MLIISLLIVALGGTIIYNKMTPNNEIENNNLNNNSNSNEILWINDEFVRKLYNEVTFKYGFIDDSKSSYYNNWYFYENNNVNLENITNDTKLALAYSSLNSNGNIKKDNKNNYFTVIDLENELKKYLVMI